MLFVYFTIEPFLKDHFKDLYGGGPSHYYFTEGQMREFIATTAFVPFLFYEDNAYQYSAEQHNCVLALYEDGPFKIFPLFHILYYNDEAKEMAILSRYSITVEGLGITRYMVLFYQRMSEERLEKIR